MLFFKYRVLLNWGFDNQNMNDTWKFYEKYYSLVDFSSPIQDSTPSKYVENGGAGKIMARVGIYDVLKQCHSLMLRKYNRSVQYLQS